MQERGLEPLHLSVLAPKASASANSATPAWQTDYTVGGGRSQKRSSMSRAERTGDVAITMPMESAAAGDMLRGMTGSNPDGVSIEATLRSRRAGLCRFGSHVTLPAVHNRSIAIIRLGRGDGTAAKTGNDGRVTRALPKGLVD